MFLVNSRLKSLAAARLYGGQALSLSYGRCFAEFLNEGCLVRLGLLDLFTCVGLRYEWCALYPHAFSRQPAHLNWIRPKASPLHTLTLCPKAERLSANVSIQKNVQAVKTASAYGTCAPGTEY